MQLTFCVSWQSCSEACNRNNIATLISGAGKIGYPHVED
jgi:hypothetical protein